MQPMIEVATIANWAQFLQANFPRDFTCDCRSLTQTPSNQ